MKAKQIFLLLFSTFIASTLFSCTIGGTKNLVKEEIKTIHSFQDGWYISLSNSPIDEVSITNEHAFASTDFGLLHFYPLNNECGGELLFPIDEERCLNHLVGSGTDEERVPISRYQYINDSLLTRIDLYCNKDSETLQEKKKNSISLKDYPLFGDGKIKLRFSSDISSQTTALAGYSELLFVDQNDSVQEFVLDNYALQDKLIGSSYYYLSREKNIDSIQFNALKIPSKSRSWYFKPSLSDISTDPLIDASFSSTFQSFFIFTRYESPNTRTVHIRSFDTHGVPIQEDTLTGPSNGIIPTSIIYSLFLDKTTFLVGEWFEKGEIACIGTTNFEELWHNSDASQHSILDAFMDSNNRLIYFLLTDGTILVIDMDQGFTIQRIQTTSEETILYSKGSIFLLSDGILGCLNNAYSNPFRSVFFYQSLSPR